MFNWKLVKSTHLPIQKLVEPLGKCTLCSGCVLAFILIHISYLGVYHRLRSQLILKHFGDGYDTYISLNILGNLERHVQQKN